MASRLTILLRSEVRPSTSCLLQAFQQVESRNSLCGHGKLPAMQWLRRLLFLLPLCPSLMAADQAFPRAPLPKANTFRSGVFFQDAFP